jgi:hypothetical protein
MDGTWHLNFPVVAKTKPLAENGTSLQSSQKVKLSNHFFSNNCLDPKANLTVESFRGYS